MRWPAILFAILAIRDVRTIAPRLAAVPSDPSFETPAITSRSVRWAEALTPIDVESVVTHSRVAVRLYSNDGLIDEEARAAFERVAAHDGAAHPLSLRLEQLVMKAAYHFHRAHVLVVSGWRPNAGRHGSGDALDFKLDHVRPYQLASYLRGMAHAGVGIYTHPRTQFVHLDVRDESYHWLDASPPGIKWREVRLRDPLASKRDAAWTPSADLPL
jgi:hypothetical protein